MSIIGVVTWPEGTAALNLHNLVLTDIPIIVEVLDKRFVLTGWRPEEQVFTAIVLEPGESPQEAQTRVLKAASDG